LSWGGSWGGKVQGAGAQGNSCHPCNPHWGRPWPTTQTANRSVQPFPNSSRTKSPVVSEQLTEKVPFTVGGPFPEIAPSRGRSGPPSNAWFIGHIQAHNPNGISIGSAELQVQVKITAQCPDFTMGRPFPPQNCPFPWAGDLDAHLIHGSLGPSESPTQTASRSVQQFISVTDRQTMSTRSITIEQTAYTYGR